MSISKVNESFYELTGRRLSGVSQLRLFSILRDHDRETLLMNIFRSYSVEDSVIGDIIFYDTYEVGSEEFWDNIAHKIYGNSNLWWVVAMMNDIVNPFEELEEGSNIKYLRSEYLYVLIKDIERLAELG